MNRITALLLCLVLTASLCACGSSPEAYKPTGEALYVEGQEVEATENKKDSNQYLELGYYPEAGLNPYTCSNYTNRVLFSLVYQGLFAVDRDYNVEPILCSRYSMTEDMLSYTFYFEEATFSDGSRLTAGDVLASCLAAMESPVYGGRFTHVDEVTMTENGGVSFRLDTACENLPILLDFPILRAEETEAVRPVGTGPYYFDQSTSGLRLRRRSQWWCSSDLLVTASSIPLTEVSSVLELRDAFEFSNVGLTCADPCSDTFAEYRCDYELWDCDNGTFLYLACNMNSKIFSNEKIRSALTFAIDRKTIADDHYRGFGQPSTLPASPSSPYYNSQLAERYAYAPEKFTQAVASNWMEGAEVVLLVNQDDSLRLRVAKDIAQSLKDCGLKVTLLSVSTREYRTNLEQGTYDLYLGQTRLSPNMDLSPFFRTGGSLRYGGLADASIYALCMQSLANRGNYYNLHETVAEDGRLCPVLFHSYSVQATRGLLTGLTPARDNIFYYSLGKTMADTVIH